ncbi:MAG: AAA family ATPase [Saprospiraceae bacterium]
MLDHLEIQNFRLFEELSINGLKRINLFTGKNNAGKTALLEAPALPNFVVRNWPVRSTAGNHELPLAHSSVARADSFGMTKGNAHSRRLTCRTIWSFQSENVPARICSRAVRTSQR